MKKKSHTTSVQVAYIKQNGGVGVCTIPVAKKNSDATSAHN